MLASDVAACICLLPLHPAGAEEIRQKWLELRGKAEKKTAKAKAADAAADAAARAAAAANRPPQF